MISYVEAVEKIWESFAQVVTYAPYKLGFDGSKWRASWGLTSKLFVYAIHNLDSFMPKFGYFSDPLDNFNFLLQLNNIVWYTLKLSYNYMK